MDSDFCWKLEEKMIKEKETHIKDLEQMVKNSTIFYEKYLQVENGNQSRSISYFALSVVLLINRYTRILR